MIDVASCIPVLVASTPSIHVATLMRTPNKQFMTMPELTDEAMLALFQGWSRLRELSIAHPESANKVTDRSMQEIRKCKFLRKLRLFYFPHVNSGEFLEALGDLTSMQELQLDLVGWSLKPAVASIFHVAQNKKIQQTRDRMLLASLSRMQGLRSLHLHYPFLPLTAALRQSVQSVPLLHFSLIGHQSGIFDEKAVHALLEERFRRYPFPMEFLELSSEPTGRIALQRTLNKTWKKDHFIRHGLELVHVVKGVERDLPR